MISVDGNKRAIDLTASEVYAMLLEAVEEVTARISPPIYNKEERYVVGLEGIMQAVGCKKWKACKLHKSGMFNDAISEVGRNMVVDVEKAREIARKNKLTKN